MRSSNAVVILVLGILSFVGFGCIAGLPAWLMGNQALADMDRGYVDATDRNLVQVGRALGMITTILTLAGGLIFAGCIALLGGVAVLGR
ncbi:MAG: hypothetical protein QOJ65_15 [Fimbriimonadaceae bacterium]|jgi:hypothetical protein|nr:hypothetical protein [Fimbriimonadaceae bacterium]